MNKSFILFIATFLILTSGLSSQAWECDVAVTGPGGITIDQAETYTATGTPTGGSYSWSRTTNLTGSGDSAVLIGYVSAYSEYIPVGVKYTTPKGKTCGDTKWVWVCLCDDVEITSDKDEAEIAEPVELTAKADSTDGTFAWSISKGTGSISGTDANATFIGDAAGEVEIRVDYTPKEGGEPCKGFKTINVLSNCEIKISAAGGSTTPLGGTIQLTATEEPKDGTFQWIYIDDGLRPDYVDGKQTGAADLTPRTAGDHVVTVKYTTPDNEECEDSLTITAYKVQSLSPKLVCYDSGASFDREDFNISTEPAGYQDKVNFIPPSISIVQQTSDETVIGSCGDGDLDDASTVVTLVNKNNTLKPGISIDIPNKLTEPLAMLGIAEELEFSLSGGYVNFLECCGSETANSTTGETTLDAKIQVIDRTLIGVQLPKAVKDILTFDAVAVSVTGSTHLSVKGEYRGCEDITKWSGGGTVALTGSAGAKLKVKVSHYILIEGALAGATSITQTVAVTLEELTVVGEWGGLTLTGLVLVQTRFGELTPYKIDIPLVEKKTLPSVKIPFPLLTN